MPACSLTAAEREPDQPEDEQNGRQDPQDMHGEPNSCHQQHQQQYDDDQHGGHKLQSASRSGSFPIYPTTGRGKRTVGCDLRP